MSATYEIYPIYQGEIPVHDKSSFTYQHNQGVKVKCPFISFLLRGAGKNILVDTGPCTEEWAKKYHMPIHIPTGRDLLSALKSDFDLEPADIDYIINTHLHWDHACGNHLFPGKKIYVQRAELHYAIDPLPIHRPTYESPQYGVISSWMRAADQLELVDGDLRLDDGIELILLPGHSDGLQGVLVNTAEGEYLLANDCVNLYENWEGTDMLPYIVPGLHSDLKACFQSFEKIARLVRERGIKILPGHDYKVLEHKVYPAQP